MDLNTLRETDESVVILPGARVVGDVTFGGDCSVWYNAVIRGDGQPIRLGRGVNVQDNAVLHSDQHSTVVGDHVTIGHSAIVHGCTVGEGSTIGMGAIVLNGARVGKECMVGAGAVVTGKTNAPDRSLLLGNPAKIVRQLTEEEVAGNYENARHYVELKELYR